MKSVYLDDHTGYVEDLVAGPDGKVLLSVSWDQTARLWSVPDGKPRLAAPHMGIATRRAVAGDNVHLATVAEGLVRIWRRSEGTAADIRSVNWRGVAPKLRRAVDRPGIWHEQAVAVMPASSGPLVVGDASLGAAAGPRSARGQLVDSCICADNSTWAAASEEKGVGWLSLTDVSGGRPCAPGAVTGVALSVAARPSAPRGRPSAGGRCSS